MRLFIGIILTSWLFGAVVATAEDGSLKGLLESAVNDAKPYPQPQHLICMQGPSVDIYRHLDRALSPLLLDASWNEYVKPPTMFVDIGNITPWRWFDPDPSEAICMFIRAGWNPQCTFDVDVELSTGELFSYECSPAR